MIIIGFSFETNGMNELMDRFDKMSKKADELSKKETVSFSELFTDDFMSSHTKYQSFDEMLSEFGYGSNITQEDFDAIPRAELDTKVSENTGFESFQDLLDKAGSEYVSKQLGF